MHRSRLATLVIDVPPDKFEAAAAFWSAALGHEVKDLNDTDRYKLFEGHFDKLQILLQRTEDGPEVHLDIHTDDVPAETQRLEALGATKKGEFPRWQVMETPTGHPLCVVKDKRENLEDANEWDT